MLSHGHILLSSWTLRRWQWASPPKAQKTHLFTHTPSGNGKVMGLPKSVGSALGSSSWLAHLHCLRGIIPFFSCKGEKLSLLPPSLKSLTHRVLWGEDCWYSTASPEPRAAVTQLSTIYWNNRLFILNLTSNMVMVSFYIYTELFIPEDPKMFQLLMGSSCLIADGMTAQQCRAGAPHPTGTAGGIQAGETELPKLQFSQDAWG